MTMAKLALSVLAWLWFYGFPAMPLARVRVRRVEAFRSGSRSTRRR